jgi:hypothetical protein
MKRLPEKDRTSAVEVNSAHRKRRALQMES